ncbi:MAG: UDP-N-acetylglucosamine 1-carboxyvinyltransferase [Parcubacteria group bacterium Gr01-1014_18]|nr:MAG: UDP-N-acetylglucosamine 1-carboxyvinyltransferase [Parcubacteria group bacterium Greene0416_36]TSC81075.1 MAG: UDP-N-acetylglucosamine 1-carboxyvinyltransferase [Parcubacteria group bacterium Gr01-1014_18]TSC98809.1 MAG: UDP-N-acetylglucosamine 1-carboxyvinyltransferase [Parcubacteria group bacterium Greene1014_20]TSD06711.1 MAG: UDP-N-acetylglucosamine 1-carboxyvinyltransferase [Parcubacteria group bacterium Greene0714_2]
MSVKKTNVSDQSKIGQFITELRTMKGWNQSEFAKALNTSQSAVARMEKGDQNFTTEMLSKISLVLNREVITLGNKSMNFKISGGYKLSGRIATNTSKNAAVGLLCASLMNRGKTLLRRVPKIEEVHRICEVLSSIGVVLRWQGDDLLLDATSIDLSKMNIESAKKTRSIIMFLGALASRLPSFSIPLAGGCKLGDRTVTPHIYGLEKFGLEIAETECDYQASSKKMKASAVVLYEMGDTVTENVLMAASQIPGWSTIKMASSNYMVQDLCHFLVKLGVQIEGIGTSVLRVYGKRDISQSVEYELSEDPIESMFFLSLAICTESEIVIEACPIDFLELELLKLEKMGFKYKISKRYKGRNGVVNLVDIETFPSKLTALADKIHPMPYPGLNIDNLPFFVPIACRAEGETLIHDWVFENRAIYYTELNKLGANITLADPHRVYVHGVVEFQKADLVCPPALRPAAIMLIAMLAAKGDSVLRQVYSINRGYEDLAGRLKTLGAKIEMVGGF